MVTKAHIILGILSYYEWRDKIDRYIQCIKICTIWNFETIYEIVINLPLVSINDIAILS